MERLLKVVPQPPVEDLRRLLGSGDTDAIEVASRACAHHGCGADLIVEWQAVADAGAAGLKEAVWALGTGAVLGPEETALLRSGLSADDEQVHRWAADRLLMRNALEPSELVEYLGWSTSSAYFSVELGTHPDLRVEHLREVQGKAAIELALIALARSGLESPAALEWVAPFLESEHEGVVREAVRTFAHCAPSPGDALDQVRQALGHRFSLGRMAAAEAAVTLGPDARVLGDPLANLACNPEEPELVAQTSARGPLYSLPRYTGVSASLGRFGSSRGGICHCRYNLRRRAGSRQTGRQSKTNECLHGARRAGASGPSACPRGNKPRQSDRAHGRCFGTHEP